MPTMRQPVIAVRGEIDVVGIAGQVVHHHLDRALLRAGEPVALDRAAEGLREQDRLAVAGDANAVGKFETAQRGVGACRSWCRSR